MFDLIDYIDLVQESVNESDAEVLMAMADTYTKSLQIMESVSEDSELYDSIFQEADPVIGKPNKSGAPVEGKAKNTGEYKTGTPDYLKDSGDDKKDEGGKLRKTNFFMKALRFIKRLWQQIITMVSSQMAKHSVKKAKKALSNAKGDQVKSPYSEEQLQELIKDLSDMKEGFESFNKKNISKEDRSTVIENIEELTGFDKKDYEGTNAERRKLKLNSIASKQTIIKYFDDSLSTFNVARSAAKNVDRIIDGWIDDLSKDERKFHESGDKDAIQQFNNASSRIFKLIRFMYEGLRIEASFFIKDKKNLNPKEENGDAAETVKETPTTEYAAETDVFSLIMESYEADHWSQFFLEADESGSIRRTNVFAKTIRFIKRLWQQILTLLTSQMMKHTIKRAKKAISNTSGDIVKSNVTDEMLNSSINGYKQATENYNTACKTFKENKSDTETMNNLARRVFAAVEFRKAYDNGDIKKPEIDTTINKTASKKTLLAYFDAAEDMIDASISFAKIVDRVLDKYVSNNSKSDIENNYNYGATLSQDSIDSLNKASTIMFKGIRSDCKEMRDIAKPYVSERKNLETKDDNNDTVQGTYDDDEE